MEKLHTSPSISLDESVKADLYKTPLQKEIIKLLECELLEPKAAHDSYMFDRIVDKLRNIPSLLETRHPSAIKRDTVIACYRTSLNLVHHPISDIAQAKILEIIALRPKSKPVDISRNLFEYLPEEPITAETIYRFIKNGREQPGPFNDPSATDEIACSSISPHLSGEEIPDFEDPFLNELFSDDTLLSSLPSLPSPQEAPLSGRVSKKRSRPLRQMEPSKELAYKKIIKLLNTLPKKNSFMFDEVLYKINRNPQFRHLASRDSIIRCYRNSLDLKSCYITKAVGTRILEIVKDNPAIGPTDISRILFDLPPHLPIPIGTIRHFLDKKIKEGVLENSSSGTLLLKG